MALPRILVLVLAGGAGGRLELLTEHRAKPAVPFAGVYRLIDFPLSNCQHSAIADVWVSVQFHPTSLSDHLANGRPWDLDRTSGGLLVLQPRLGHDEREGFQQGTADSLWRNAPLVRELAPEALVVVSADAIYKLDYGALVEEHLEAGAEVTIVTYEVDPDEVVLDVDTHKDVHVAAVISALGVLAGPPGSGPSVGRVWSAPAPTGPPCAPSRRRADRGH